MAKVQYYFRSSQDEYCYTLDYHLIDAKDEGLTEIDLFEAVPENFPGIFWCKAAQECAEEGYCGKLCDDYAPKNGKSGMCRHKGTTYTHGEKVTFKV